MSTFKIAAGDSFPLVMVKSEEGRTVPLIDTAAGDPVWHLVVVYRGQHCPICLNYLNELEMLAGRFQGQGVNVQAVSADTKEQLDQFRVNGLAATYPVRLELSVPDMQRLGLYISEPMSPDETDHLFAEPALFLVNPKGKVQIVDIANAPFVRPSLEELVRGVEYIMEYEYPTRGTYQGV